MALGFLARGDANVYLLMGVPLTIAFQLWIARRGVETLWVRDATGWRLDRRGIVLAALLAAAPAYELTKSVAGRGSPVVVAWLSCSLVGAVAAAFAFRRFRRSTLRALLGCALTAGVAGAALMLAAALARPASPQPALSTGVRSFLLYLPVTFVLEEVFFRGAIDAYVHRPADPHRWMSAILVSVLWGVWHLPIAPAKGVATLASLVLIHTIVGVPLSLYWRSSGNLGVPATVHALIDAMRNSVLAS